MILWGWWGSRETVMGVKRLPTSAAPQKAQALLEYQVYQRDRKCCPNGSSPVGVNKATRMGLGGGAWRATLGQDFCRASMVKIWARWLSRAIAISVSCYSPLNIHSPVRDFGFPCTPFLLLCLYFSPFLQPSGDITSQRTPFCLQKKMGG